MLFVFCVLRQHDRRGLGYGEWTSLPALRAAQLLGFSVSRHSPVTDRYADNV